MTINYTGNRKFNTRLAEMECRENEVERFNKVVEYMESLGYPVDNGVECWAAIEVIDRDEYERVVQDYKEAKRKIK